MFLSLKMIPIAYVLKLGIWKLEVTYVYGVRTVSFIPCSSHSQVP